MGLVNFGVPKNDVAFLRQEMDLSVFIEGGTYTGGTAKEMSSIFSNVFTIEKSSEMFKRAEESLKNYNNVTLLFGDSRQHIEDLFIRHDNILFWLDAHWSGGETYGENDECPLIEELQIIFKNTESHNFCILIDDARLFLAPPPKPHKIDEWPSIAEIVEVMPNGWKMACFEDVIYLLPSSAWPKFTVFMQNKISKDIDDKRSSMRLQNYVQKMKSLASFISPKQ